MGAVYTIGISSHFHDSACCILRDGALVAAAEEERFSRVKHDPRMPRHAFRYCLEEAGVAIDQIAAVGYFEMPGKKLERQLWMGLPHLPLTRSDTFFRFDPTAPEREIREILGYEGPIFQFEHHHSHAASAYYFSGFDDAAILTVDGVGEWATTLFGYGRGADLDVLSEVHFPHSLGLLYSAVTNYLGFEVNEGEYKVMGLAPYGKPEFLPRLRQLVECDDHGSFRLIMDYFDFTSDRRMYSQKFVELMGRGPREPESELDQFSKDVAKSVQTLIEEVLLKLARALHQRHPSENLCMAGGVALNCVANGRILREGPFKRLFVQPAASDAGCSLGAAALAHRKLRGIPRRRAMPHACWGPAVNRESIVPALSDHIHKFHNFSGKENELLRYVARQLAAGKVVGWCQGRMEFGPRSLGARSILADPRRPEMRDRINALVKLREAFRPFAPAVLAARAREHFDLDHPSPFMLETCQVRSSLKLPSITHEDGSARVQTVDDNTPRFEKLLRAFERETGCPILLNTSFNMRGEPIVRTSIDALLCFIRSDIDLLALGDVVMHREQIPSAWLRWFRNTSPRKNSSISTSTYTLF